MSQGLFRDVSMERLSSPEQLDELIKVTSPRSWLALLAIIVIIASAVVWGFLGSIPTKISGDGILLYNGGVFSLQHHTPGQVLDIRFDTGQLVQRGDVIARIELPEKVADINHLTEQLRQMESNQLSESQSYRVLEDRIERVREELIYKSQVVSQIDGRILELHISHGQMIQPGLPIATLEQLGGTVKMEAVIFVPVEQGGLITPGMEAQISPTIVNKEEYGFLLGRVISVSEYPVTTAGMIQTLGNENLVAMLAGQGASLMVRIDLIPDVDTQSGYRWSSPDGPPTVIHSGTIVQSAVVIQRERPVNKVIPMAKRMMP